MRRFFAFMLLLAFVLGGCSSDYRLLWLVPSDDGRFEVVEIAHDRIEPPYEGWSLGTVDTFRFGPNGDLAIVEVDDLVGEGAWEPPGEPDRSCRDDAHCVAIDDDRLTLLETTDGGETWDTIFEMDPAAPEAGNRSAEGSSSHQLDGGFRQVAMASDGSVAAVFGQDDVLIRNPDGRWNRDEASFRSIGVLAVGSLLSLAVLVAIAARRRPSPGRVVAAAAVAPLAVGALVIVSWMRTGSPELWPGIRVVAALSIATAAALAWPALRRRAAGPPPPTEADQLRI